MAGDHVPQGPRLRAPAGPAHSGRAVGSAPALRASHMLPVVLLPVIPLPVVLLPVIPLPVVPLPAAGPTAPRRPAGRSYRADMTGSWPARTMTAIPAAAIRTAPAIISARQPVPPSTTSTGNPPTEPTGAATPCPP